MNLYSYIAVNNPSMAKALCHKYGYEVTNVQNKKDLGVCLEKLVANEGEIALKDIVHNHPDKEIILEVCKDELQKSSNDNSDSFSIKHNQVCECAKNQYMNFAGEEKATTRSLVSQTNTIIIASAMLLAVAIVTIKS